MQRLAVQRQQDANDLTGTVFEPLDRNLKLKLADPAVWPPRVAKPTLSAALNERPNAEIATLARVASAITAAAPFLWEEITKISGTSITDNFALQVQWRNGPGLAARLSADKGWCKDNETTAKHYHNTPLAYRQLPKNAGAASLHVIPGGNTDVHIDHHQPVEGREEPSGECDIDWAQWRKHAADVAMGGGVRNTPVARYGGARHSIERIRGSFFTTDHDRMLLRLAEEKLDTIVGKVQKYAVIGGMAGDEWEGDRQMLADTFVMEQLNAAERLIARAD